MPVTIQAKGEFGNAILAEIFDDHNILDKYSDIYSDSQFLIRYIDPYGDTMMNHIQLRQFLAELVEIIKRAEIDDIPFLLSLKEIVEFCLKFPHQYLWFYGD